MRTHLLIGAAVAAFVIPASGAHAQQTTSSIRGTVTQDGVPVAGATVTATNVATGATVSGTSGENGNFTLGGLQPGGPYSVEVTSAAGNSSITDIYTVVGQPYTLPVELAAVGDEEIVVTAGSIAGAGTLSDGPQTVLTREEISRVATVNRDVRDLMRRDPFARLEDTAGGGRAVSFAGVNPRFNRFSVDGVTVSDNFGLNPDANPTRRGPVPIDAISQFSVSVAPYDIRQGNFTGGAVDSVLLSGTNTFTGTGFYSQNTSGLTSDRIGSTTVDLDFKSETYGATIAGPIIRDKLFFMISGERNTEGNPLSPIFEQIPGLTRDEVSAVQGIASSVYGYEAGDNLTISNDKDEKIVGKIDWNITDGHRLSLSYINAYDETSFQQNVSTNNNQPSIGLASNGYALTELLRSGIAQLNSEWTDVFSTEARFLYKSYERGQNSLLGTGFAQFGVCTDPTSVGAANQCSNASGGNPGSARVFLGPDSSRQSNEFFTDTYAGSILARVNMNDHDLRILAEYNETRIFNLFLQNTDGNYYFDSLADFQNRRANSVIFQRPASGDPNDAAADFKYSAWTFGIQDDWRVTDRLSLSFGARYDLYGSRSPVPLNPGFTQRYGFSNTETFKGLGVFSPRISFDYEPIDDLKIRGGYGIFAGGAPDVYLSNSYSNAGAGIGGVGINSVNIQRVTSAAGVESFTINGAPLDSAIGQAILNNVDGDNIPAALQGTIANTGPNGLANINALDRDFDIPSVSKFTLSADWTPRDFLGGGWTFGADYYYSRTNNSVVFTDLRSVPIGTLPDGRTRYGPLVGTNTNTDIILTNGSNGRSHIGVVRVNKQFDWGLNLDFAYSLQDVKDEQPATSSTAGSNYGNGAFLGDRAAYGTANEQVAWSFKYGVGFDRAFFGDYRTIFQLFGETFAGRPYSFTMGDAGSTPRSAVFGLTGRDDRYLLYVPQSGTDAIVSYDSAETQQQLDTLIENSKLKGFRGQIAPRNIARARATTRIDLHLEQEIPTFIGRSRISVFADIENLPNLLNRDWGGFRQSTFPYLDDVVQVQCLTTPVATGTAPTSAQIAANSSQACAQYRYSSYAEPAEDVLELRRSLYLIRLGARFTF
ncbi:TonB-dependent receptor [Sphingomonas baiyangensis]|uniref:TonB-dependent receptor n=1 Tax=Sphingomonas baiyangensis TaxID=2572576 RepID=A0A4U1L463_9SPHN|nr:carboxypeptidase regulatory-like domain-containing protein [Sphingomonas baiyangensis]TKD51707.1 TonB-dependent receptor [Sphingomonas baiyangensis]